MQQENQEPLEGETPMEVTSANIQLSFNGIGIATVPLSAFPDKWTKDMKFTGLHNGAMVIFHDMSNELVSRHDRQEIAVADIAFDTYKSVIAQDGAVVAMTEAAEGGMGGVGEQGGGAGGIGVHPLPAIEDQVQLMDIAACSEEEMAVQFIDPLYAGQSVTISLQTHDYVEAADIGGGEIIIGGGAIMPKP